MSQTVTPMLLAVNPGLRAATRVGWMPLNRSIPGAAEWACLVLASIVAASASTFLDFNLRIPGHAILRAVFPITAGLAFVPRRGAGTAMGLMALSTALGFRVAGYGGEGLSLGALTSLTATGPLLDFALRRTQGGWKLYVSCALSGLASNSLALAVKTISKLAGWEHAGSRPLKAWLSEAIVTYIVCGFLAGLMSAGIWFYARRPRVDDLGMSA